MPFTLDETNRTFNYGLLVKKVHRNFQLRTEDVTLTPSLYVEVVPIPIEPKKTRIPELTLPRFEEIENDRLMFLDD